MTEHAAAQMGRVSTTGGDVGSPLSPHTFGAICEYDRRATTRLP